MQAKFEQVEMYRPVIVIEPDDDTERILMASFIRYDANVFRVSVERYENGKIRRVELQAEEAR